MRPTTIAAAVFAAILSACVLAGTARAGDKSDFALFDGTNPANQPFSGALCMAEKPGKQGYTYHVTVSNYGAAGFVRITYTDGDIVQYKIPVDGTLQISQAAGNKGGADTAVRVSNGGSGAVLSGAMSAVSASKVTCISCDADSSGDAGCDAILAD